MTSTTDVVKAAPEKNRELTGGAVSTKRQIAERRKSPWPTICWVLVTVSVVAGTVIRAGYVWHRPLNSDQAVVGLMANGILHGHFSAFYWGQNYGGAEPYVVAGLFAIFGHGWLTLTLTPPLLMAITSVLVWRVALRLVDDRLLAAIAGALVWVVPGFGAANSTEFGFRNLALLCGVACLLEALRILDGRRRYIDAVGFGLIAGLAWWASPESAFFLLPAAALVVGAIIGSWGESGLRFWGPRLAAAAGALVVGALPWLWPNVSDRFLSLQLSLAGTPRDHGYLSHLHTFFFDALPLQLGFLRFGIGNPLIPGVFGSVVLRIMEGTLVMALLLCLTRPGRARVIAAAVLIFPLLYAINPLTWWWLDGRYSVYLPPLLSLVLVIGAEQFPWIALRTGSGRSLHGRPPSPAWARRGMAGVVAVSLALALLGFHSISHVNSGRLVEADPNAPTEQSINELEQRHVTMGFANYWVAYKLDFLSGQRLVFSPGVWDEMRSLPLYDQVSRQQRQGWLFVPVKQLGTAGLQFGTTNLQTGFVSEPAFLRKLRSIGDPYQIVHTELLDAVIPQRPVAPAQAGIPGSDQ